MADVIYRGLPKDYEARKNLPVFDVLAHYFPDAWVEVTKVAVAGNVQHNPGEPLHWARGKSMDQLNTAMRHLLDHAAYGEVFDTEPPEVIAAIGDDGTMHLAKAAWRVLAELQLTVEKIRDARRQSESADRQSAAEVESVLPKARGQRNGKANARLRGSRVKVRNRVSHRGKGPRR